MESFETLIRALSAKPNPSATAAELESFTQQSKRWIVPTAPPFEIPPELAAIYKIANGFAGDRRLSFNAMSVNLLGTYPSLGLVALSESNDSNPYCVACVPPLTGYVVRLRHDGDSDIQFRSIQAFVRALLRLIEKKDWRINDLVPELRNDNGARDERDSTAGLEQNLPSHLTMSSNVQ